MSETNGRLFPKYLGRGSRGRAVVFLQYLLLAAGCNSGITPDGEYGEETAHGVAKLQYQLGFPITDLDGEFGTVTRAALLKRRGLDIDAIPDDLFDDLFDDEVLAVEPGERVGKGTEGMG